MLQHLRNPVLLPSFLLAGLLSWGCTNDKREAPAPADSLCDTLPVSYQQHIRLLVAENCATAGCHVAGSENGDFTQYAPLKAKADQGEIRKQVLVRKTMPPGDPLSQKELQLIDCWLRQGAPEN